MKGTGFGVLAVCGVMALAGCATGSGRNYDAELDSLNTKVASLQGALSAKDQEVARLESELSEERSRSARAEADRQTLSSKLDGALSELNAAKAREEAEAASKKRQKAKLDESDLK